MSIHEQNRVAVYHSNQDIRVGERRLPEIGAGDALMEVHASGICGSDVMEWYRLPKAPTVLGHEVAGRIVAVGEGVTKLEVGERVITTHHVPCLTCHYCLSGRETVCDMLRQTSFDPGGFAEFIRIPAINVERGTLKLPDGVSHDAGSMVEPLGCVLRAHRKAGLKAGDKVLIVGAGVSGCLHILAARALGAGRVFASETRAHRREFAAQLGADAVFDPAEPIPELLRADMGRGVDVVILCTGARGAIDQALQSVDRGGTVLFFAPMGPDESYDLPFNEVFWRNDAMLTSSYGAGIRDLTQALDLIEGGRIEVERLITHRLPLAQTQTAFEMMLQAGDSLKIIIDPHLDSERTRIQQERHARSLSTSG